MAAEKRVFESRSGLVSEMRQSRGNRSWWTRRFLAYILPNTDDETLRSGGQLSRHGAIHRLVLEPGRIEAELSEDHQDSCSVTFQFPVPDETVWEALAEQVGENTEWLALLLAGKPGESKDGAGVQLENLFVAGKQTRTCTCEKTSCVHHVAALLALAPFLDDDPFLLFLLFGQGKKDFLGRIWARWQVVSGGEEMADSATQGLRCSSDFFRFNDPAPELSATANDSRDVFKVLGDPPFIPPGDHSLIAGLQAIMDSIH